MSPKYDFAKVKPAGDDSTVVYIDPPLSSDTRPLRLAAKRPAPGALLQTAGYPNEKVRMMMADKNSRVQVFSADGTLFTDN
jgi:hypothetical protein